MSKRIVWTKYTSPETKFYNKIKNKKGIFIQSHNGIVFPDNAIDKRYNLYEGDANFLITFKEYKMIVETIGVEILQPVSGYKILVGIAKMFNDKTVLSEIDKKIDPYMGIHEQIVSNYLNLAKQKYENYVLYEDMNGMIRMDDEAKINDIDGFVIFRKNPAPSGQSGV